MKKKKQESEKVKLTKKGEKAVNKSRCFKSEIFSQKP